MEFLIKLHSHRAEPEKQKHGFVDADYYHVQIARLSMVINGKFF
jgi:hypothetical protein